MPNPKNNIITLLKTITSISSDFDTLSISKLIKEYIANNTAVIINIFVLNPHNIKGSITPILLKQDAEKSTMITFVSLVPESSNLSKSPPVLILFSFNAAPILMLILSVSRKNKAI